MFPWFLERVRGLGLGSFGLGLEGGLGAARTQVILNEV